MDEWTVIAYAAFGVSSFVSALQIGRWILHANPRTIINVGRWSLVGLAVLALGVLLWLMVSGRWTFAMMLGAFIMPVFVQAAPRWRVLLGPLNALRTVLPAAPSDFWTPGRQRGLSARRTIDPALVQQSIAVLTAYLEEA